MMHYSHISPQRGFALLISVILTSVMLAVGIGLLDIAYKQVVLASSAKNSQFAFYNADSALECALYYDQQQAAFYYGSNYNLNTVQCSNTTVTNPTRVQAGNQETTTFYLPCGGGGTSAYVTIIKTSAGATNIYANGYSSCDPDGTDKKRIERGLKAKY